MNTTILELENDLFSALNDVEKQEEILDKDINKLFKYLDDVLVLNKIYKTIEENNIDPVLCSFLKQYNFNTLLLNSNMELIPYDDNVKDTLLKELTILLHDEKKGIFTKINDIIKKIIDSIITMFKNVIGIRRRFDLTIDKYINLLKQDIDWFEFEKEQARVYNAKTVIAKLEVDGIKILSTLENKINDVKPGIETKDLNDILKVFSNINKELEKMGYDVDIEKLQIKKNDKFPQEKKFMDVRGYNKTNVVTILTTAKKNIAEMNQMEVIIKKMKTTSEKAIKKIESEKPDNYKELSMFIRNMVSFSAAVSKAIVSEKLIAIRSILIVAKLAASNKRK